MLCHAKKGSTERWGSSAREGKGDYGVGRLGVAGEDRCLLCHRLADDKVLGLGVWVRGRLLVVHGG